MDFMPGEVSGQNWSLEDSLGVGGIWWGRARKGWSPAEGRAWPGTGDGAAQAFEGSLRGLGRLERTRWSWGEASQLMSA